MTRLERHQIPESSLECAARCKLASGYLSMWHVQAVRRTSCQDVPWGTHPVSKVLRTNIIVLKCIKLILRFLRFFMVFLPGASKSNMWFLVICLEDKVCKVLLEGLGICCSGTLPISTPPTAPSQHQSQPQVSPTTMPQSMHYKHAHIISHIEMGSELLLRGGRLPNRLFTSITFYSQGSTEGLTPKTKSNNSPKLRNSKTHAAMAISPPLPCRRSLSRKASAPQGAQHSVGSRETWDENAEAIGRV